MSRAKKKQQKQSDYNNMEEHKVHNFDYILNIHVLTSGRESYKQRAKALFRRSVGVKNKVFLCDAALLECRMKKKDVKIVPL